MKRMHLIAIVAIGLSIALLVSMSGEMSKYASFEDAVAAPGTTMQVVGLLVKEKPMTYDPVKDANSFGFFMTDSKGREMEVVYAGPKPTDFERTEQIVLTGRVEGDKFMASDMLLKCPSKYTAQEVKLKENS